MEKSENRVWTLEAINSLVPKLSEIVRGQLQLRAEIETILAQLGRELGDVPERIVLDPADPTEIKDLKEALVKRIEAYRAGWRQIEDMGAVLKDPRTGMLDFYGQVDGKMVWLCWKYGETEVTSYHHSEEGFNGRKPLKHSAKHRLLN